MVPVLTKNVAKNENTHIFIISGLQLSDIVIRLQTTQLGGTKSGRKLG